MKVVCIEGWMLDVPGRSNYTRPCEKVHLDNCEGCKRLELKSMVVRYQAPVIVDDKFL
jgi:hypothetical protein